MFRALLGVRLRALFLSLFHSGRPGKKRGPLFKALVLLLALYIAGSAAGLFGSFFYGLAAPFERAGLSWLYFALAGLAAFALLFISGVFLAQSQLYEAKDNAMLLALPIPPRLILLSRMAALYLFTFAMQALILVPAAVAYLLQAPLSLPGGLSLAAVSLALPLLTLALSCLGGGLLALLSARIRRRSLVVTLLSVLFLLAYLFFFSRISLYYARLIENGAQVAEAVRRALFPAYHLGLAVAEGELRSLIIFLLCAAAPFLLAAAALSRSFVRIVTANRGLAPVRYQERPLKERRPALALLNKELTHFSSSPMYMLNGAMGVLFTLLLPAALLVKRDLLEAALSQFAVPAGLAAPAAVLALCMISATNIISAPSVSLEGRSLWILRSFPVDPGMALRAKAGAHAAVCLPPLAFAAAALSFLLEATPLAKAMLFVLPALFTAFDALLGVAVNLRFPRLEWNSETEAIKQGASTIVTMLACFTAVAAPALLYALLLSKLVPADLYMALLSLAFLGASALLWRYLGGARGREAFETLG